MARAENPSRRIWLERILLVAGFVTITPLLCAPFYWWDSHVNHGWHWGYYGDFNSVKDAIESVPDLTIVNRWENDDLTLEEFAFFVRRPDGKQIQLGFSEDDEIRHLRGASLRDSILRRLEG